MKKAVLHPQLAKQPSKILDIKTPVIFDAAVKFAIIVKYRVIKKSLCT
jgi:hypothetical protein